MYGTICAGATAEVIDPVPAAADSVFLCDYLPRQDPWKRAENTYDNFYSFNEA